MENETKIEEIAPLLRSAVLRLARRLRVERGLSALSNNKIAVLSNLVGEKNGTPSRIAVEERQRLQSLTRPIADLEADGFIMRSADPRDGRRNILNITPAGREALDADMKLRDEWLCNILSELDEHELGILYRAAQIIDHLEESFKSSKN